MTTAQRPGTPHRLFQIRQTLSRVMPRILSFLLYYIGAAKVHSGAPGISSGVLTSSGGFSALSISRCLFACGKSGLSSRTFSNALIAASAENAQATFVTINGGCRVKCRFLRRRLNCIILWLDPRRSSRRFKTSGRIGGGYSRRIGEGYSRRIGRITDAPTS